MNPGTGRTPTRARYEVVALLVLMAAMANMDRVCIAITMPFIQKDLFLTDDQVGCVLGSFYFAYALFEVPSGWMADRFGVRLTLTRIVLWWSAMTAFTGLAGGFWSLVALRVLFGLGEAGMYPSVNRAFSRWLPVTERGRAFGLVAMGLLLGAAATQPLVANMLLTIDWRYIFPILGVVGVLWTVIWHWRFRDNPHEHPRVDAAELAQIGTPAQVVHTPVPWAQLVSHRTFVALSLSMACAFYSINFSITWLPIYLLRVHELDLKQVGWWAGLILVLQSLGSFTGGFLNDWLRRRWGLRRGRALPAVICCLLAATLFSGAIFAPSAMSAAFLLAFAGVFALMVNPLSFAVCTEIAGKHAGTVSGAMNMVTTLAGAISPIVVGQCLRHLDSWTIPMSIMGISYFLAAVCWFFINPAEKLFTSVAPRQPESSTGILGPGKPLPTANAT